MLVSIDTGSLPDPLLQPKGQGMVVVPRPGIAALVSLPLAPTGEIEAVLLGPDGEPRSGVPLQLLDQRGLAVRQASSDFDGFVLLDAVPYGTYSLAIPAETATVLGVRPQLGVTVTIDKAHASQRLGRVRLELLPPAPTLAAAP